MAEKENEEEQKERQCIDRSDLSAARQSGGGGGVGWGVPCVCVCGGVSLFWLPLSLSLDLQTPPLPCCHWGQWRQTRGVEVVAGGLVPGLLAGLHVSIASSYLKSEDPKGGGVCTTFQNWLSD